MCRYTCICADGQGTRHLLVWAFMYMYVLAIFTRAAKAPVRLCGFVGSSGSHISNLQLVNQTQELALF